MDQACLGPFVSEHLTQLIHVKRAQIDALIGHQVQKNPGITAFENEWGDRPGHHKGRGHQGEVARVEKRVGEQDEAGADKEADAYHTAAQKGADHGAIGFREEAGHHRNGRYIDGGADDIGRHAGINGCHDVKAQQESCKYQQVVEGVKHQCHGQAETRVQFADEEQNHQADDVERAPKIAKKLNHPRLGGKLIADGIVELIIHDGDHHVGHEGQHHKDFDQHRGSDQGQYGFKLPDHAGVLLFATLFTRLKQHGWVPPPHGPHGPGPGQSGEHVYQQQVVQVQPAGNQRGGETAQNLADHPAGGDQWEQPFGLPGVEKIVGQVPEQQSQQHLILGLEHEQDRVDQIDAEGYDRPNDRHRQPAKDKKPRQQSGAGQTGHEPGHGPHDEDGQYRIDHVHNGHVFDAVTPQERGFGVIVQQNPRTAHQKQQGEGPHKQTELILMHIEPAAYLFSDGQQGSCLSPVRMPVGLKRQARADSPCFSRCRHLSGYGRDWSPGRSGTVRTSRKPVLCSRLMGWP